MGLGPRRGGWGMASVPTPGGGKGGDRWEGRGSEGSVASISPAHLGPREAAEILGLTLCPPRPPPASWVLREKEGRKGEQK